MREICTYLHAQEKGLANIRERGKNKIMEEDLEGEREQYFESYELLWKKKHLSLKP